MDGADPTEGQVGSQPQHRVDHRRDEDLGDRDVQGEAVDRGRQPQRGIGHGRAADRQPARVGHRIAVEVEQRSDEEHRQELQDVHRRPVVEHVEVAVPPRDEGNGPDRHEDPSRQHHHRESASEQSDQSQAGQHQVADELVVEGPQRSVAHGARDPDLAHLEPPVAEHVIHRRHRGEKDVRRRGEVVAEAGVGGPGVDDEPHEGAEKEGGHQERHPEAGEDPERSQPEEPQGPVGLGAASDQVAGDPQEAKDRHRPEVPIVEGGNLCVALSYTWLTMTEMASTRRMKFRLLSLRDNASPRLRCGEPRRARGR